MIFQGLSPTIFGDFGDMAGRRPAYILAFLIYICANIGLALQRNFVALLILRCVQSAGSSGTLALGFAVVADISSTAERGKYMGIVGAGINVGPALGPVLGGILSQYLGWPAIFWFCAIFSGVWMIPFILSAPETCRKVVGNGSIAPPKWNRSLLDLYSHRGDVTSQNIPKQKLKFPNPLKTLYIVFEKEMAIILCINAIIYLAFILVAATL
jgi:multidrug resistance protein